MKKSRLVLVLPAVLAAGLIALLPASADAQRRGVARGGHARVSVFVGSGYYYPHYYSPFWDSSFWGWYPWGFYPQYPIYRGRWEETSAAKILVTPREAEVYVDGYFVGTVDDFDGTFQSLRLPPGEHEIQLYLEGYRRVSRKVRFRPGETYKLRYTMVQLGSGEAGDPKPVPTEPPPAPEPRDPRPPFDPRDPRAPFEPRAPFDPRAPRAPFEPREPGAPAGGTLAIRVQPPNADVFIDGERWDGPAGFDRLEVQVPEGVHRIEVRKDGYETFSTEVQVSRGETRRLNISLPRVQRM